MIVEEHFTLDAPVERVWAVLRDVPRVAPCIPNAQITEKIDEQTYKAKVGVKAGPVTVNYRATIVMAAIDDEAHTATIDVTGDDVTGRGGVRATLTMSVTAAAAGSHVTLLADAQVSGIIATVGGRLIEGVAKKTTAQFAANLAALVA